MKSLRIAVGEDVAHWVHVRAAEQEKSVSRFVGEMLQREMFEEKGYEESMKRFLSRQPSRIHEGGRYPSREELHDRAGLRRQ